MFVISENRSEQCFEKSLRKLHVCTKTIQVTDYTTNHVPGSTKEGVKASKRILGSTQENNTQTQCKITGQTYIKRPSCFTQG